jgi:NAD+ synthase
MFPNSRVVNTSNYSERYIGYSTKWGDGVGDFSLFGLLTVREVLAIGDALGLPKHLVHKTPADGMSGKSDEEKIGFSYNDLDSYILGDLSVTQNAELDNKINKMHNANMHKLNPIPAFVPDTIPLTELWGGT